MNDLISRQNLLNSLNRFAPEHFNALVNDLILKEPAVSFPQAHEKDHFADGGKMATQPEPCDVPDTNVGDTISRQAAIDEISKYASIWMEYNDGMTQEKVAEAALKAAKRTMVHILEELPSAQPEQRWIPVSEKPIEKGLMLVTYNDGDVDLLKQPTAYRYSDIVAWMPVHKPYKEDSKIE